MKEAQPLSLDYANFKAAYQLAEGSNHLFTLDVENQGSFWVQLKELHVHPVTRKLLHADFVKISADKPITIKVPLVLSGKALGVEKGGQLQQGERAVVVTGLPASIPGEISVDVASLGLGQTLHVSQVVLPEGLKLAKSVDLPVATVTIPKGMKAEVEAAAAAAAGPSDKKAPEKKPEKKK
jgi:large subunit ribosomal protein L25